MPDRSGGCGSGQAGASAVVAEPAGEGGFSIEPFFIAESPCSGMPLSYATLSYNNVASGHQPTRQLRVKPINILFALGAGFGGAGALFYLGTANSDTMPAAPAPTPHVKATELLRHASPARLALLSQVALVMDERDGVMLYGRAIDTPRPIASLTKP